MSFDEWFNQQQPIRAENEYLQTDVVQIYREAKRAYEAGRADERERCIQKAENERLSDGTEYDDDVAYNQAIDHVIEAIKAE